MVIAARNSRSRKEQTMNFQHHYAKVGTDKQRWTGMYGFQNGTWYALPHARYGLANDIIETNSQQEAVKVLEDIDKNYKPRKPYWMNRR
jgi:hypothetical protein